MSEDSDEKRKNKLEIELIRSQIDKNMADFAKANKDIRWYEVTLIIASTLAVIAITKLIII